MRDGRAAKIYFGQEHVKKLYESLSDELWNFFPKIFNKIFFLASSTSKTPKNICNNTVDTQLSILPSSFAPEHKKISNPNLNFAPKSAISPQNASLQHCNKQKNQKIKKFKKIKHHNPNISRHQQYRQNLTEAQKKEKQEKRRDRKEK